jgi:choline dehydrogenase-like flavoprotein
MGAKVIILEGGGEKVEELSQEPYKSEVAGLPHRGIHHGRFRALGGTTTRWGGQILELDESDFQRRGWLEGSGWPFPKSELTSSYARALQLEGLAEVPKSDCEVWKQLGLEEPHFQRFNSYLSRWTPEPKFSVLHRKALESKSITVWLHSNVVAIDLEGEVVRGVISRTLGGNENRHTAKRYVFCLGTIESTRFFLQPRVDGLPWNRSGLLGRHYQDHIDVNAALVTPKDPKRFHEVFDNIFLGRFKFHPKIKLLSEFTADRKLLNAGATMSFASDLDSQMVQLKSAARKLRRCDFKSLGAGDLRATVKNLPLLGKQAWRYKVRNRAYVPDEAKISLRVHCEQVPTSASNITLSQVRDSLGLRRTCLNWQISDLEQETIREFAIQVRQELKEVADVLIDPLLDSRDPAFRLKCCDSNHHMGGMRMSSREALGIVDPDLKLFGTQNCYVCSAAVFPTSGFSNPTHTLLALAVRLASHLRST